MVILDKNTRLIALQFKFSKLAEIPKAARRPKRETLQECRERVNRSNNGVMVIEPTKNCSLAEFLKEIEALGYEMVDELCMERIDNRNPYCKKTYYVARLLFAHHKFAEPSEEFIRARDDIRAAFLEICRAAMWQAQAFFNPFYRDSEEITDQRALSINLNARQPLFLPNGKPVMVWPKDENGKRRGTVPLPLIADKSLHIMGDFIALV